MKQQVTNATLLAYPNNYNALIAQALRCLEARLRYDSQSLNSSQEVCSYLRLHLADERNETFAVLFLNSQHRLLAFEKLFYGTINEAVVYPRKIVQKALEHNAAAVILAHNHPSGECNPSKSDIEITQKIREILNIIDVKTLDHLIVSHQNSCSFVERGLM